jgi:hypothetical protein
VWASGNLGIQKLNNTQKKKDTLSHPSPIEKWERAQKASLLVPSTNGQAEETK